MRKLWRLAVLAPLAAAALLFARCDNVSCNTVTADLALACIPDAIAPDADVRIEVRELCGLNCARFPSCTATLSAGVIVLDTHEDQCNDVAVNICPSEPCQQRVLGCKLPPLPTGEYTLRAPGLPDQLVRVRPGGAPACNLGIADGGI